MLSFVNNIRIKTPSDSKLRMLTAEEVQLIEPLFYRKSKEHFDFEDIANAAFYFGTDLSKNVTGAELVVDGGNTIQLYPIIPQ